MSDSMEIHNWVDSQLKQLQPEFAARVPPMETADSDTRAAKLREAVAAQQTAKGAQKAAEDRQALLNRARPVLQQRRDVLHEMARAERGERPAVSPHALPPLPPLPAGMTEAQYWRENPPANIAELKEKKLAAGDYPL